MRIKRRRDDRFTLSNPALRDSHDLPPFDLELLHSKGESPVITVFGLGFDPETEDYKVVGIAIFWDGPSDNRLVNYAKVYSKSKGTWTSVIDRAFEDSVLKNVSFLHGSRSISQYTWDGSLHWSVIKRVEKVNSFVELILSFDLKDGVFRFTEFPKEYFQFHVELPPFQSFSQGSNRARSPTWRIRDHSVSTLNGNLAFLASFYDGSHTSIDVWVMENCGGDYSWSHLLKVDPRPGLRHAMCFWRNGEIVIIKGCDEDDHTRGWPFLYDPAANKLKEITLSGEFDFIYRECLVPVKRVTGEELEGSRS